MPACIALRNVGSTLLNSVKLLIETDPEISLITFADDDESLPSSEKFPGSDLPHDLVRRYPGHVNVRRNRLAIELGKLRSGETSKSETFRIGARYQGQQSLAVQFISDEHPPQHFQLMLDSDSVTTILLHDDFLAKANGWTSYGRGNLESSGPYWRSMRAMFIVEAAAGHG